MAFALPCTLSAILWLLLAASWLPCGVTHAHMRMEVDYQGQTLETSDGLHDASEGVDDAYELPSTERKHQSPSWMRTAQAEPAIHTQSFVESASHAIVSTKGSMAMAGGAFVVVLLIGGGIVYYFMQQSGQKPNTGKGGGKGGTAAKAGANAKAGAKAKAKAKTNAKGAGKGGAAALSPEEQKQKNAELKAAVIEADEREIKAAIMIQCMFRQWKARRTIVAARKAGGPRPWVNQQSVCVITEVVKAHDIPTVTLLGGLAPFVEVRIVYGNNPTNEKKGNVFTPAKKELTVQTEPEEGSANPSWKDIDNCLDSVTIAHDTFVQVILWNYGGMLGNTGVAQFVVPITEYLKGLQYEPTGENANDKAYCKEISAKLSDLVSDGAMDLRSNLELRVRYYEMFKWTINVVKGSRVPKIDMDINSFVELRVCRKHKKKKDTDLKKADFSAEPPPHCIWHHKTSTCNGTIDPKWKEVFEVVLPGDPHLQMQVILWDESTFSNSPICHSIIEMKGAQCKPMGEPEERKLKFVKLPAIPPPGDFKKTIVTMTLRHDQIIVNDKEDEDN